MCIRDRGKADPLLKELHGRMEAAAEALEFEQAAVLRDQIRAVEKTVERQATVLPGGGDMDVLGLFQAERGLALGLVFVRGGAMTDGRAFYWPGLTFDLSLIHISWCWRRPIRCAERRPFPRPDPGSRPEGSGRRAAASTTAV